MKAFLSTCIALMIVAGIYGATDMTRDIRNGTMIDYEHVRGRHAKNLLFVIKTTGLGTYKFRSYAKDATEGKSTVLKSQVEQEPKEKSMVEYMEEFSRGCEDCDIIVPEEL
jgi:hypothetical protein